MFSGEYFLSEKAKEDKKRELKRESKELRKQEKIANRNKDFEAPEEEAPVKSKEKHNSSAKPDVNELKKKFLKKK